MKNRTIVTIASLLIVLLYLVTATCFASGSYYNITKDEIYLAPNATVFTADHEEGHQIFFTKLTSKEVYQWDKKFLRGLPFCYRNYAFQHENRLTGSAECFADIYSLIKGNTYNKAGLQYWYGEDYTKSWQYKFVKNLLK